VSAAGVASVHAPIHARPVACAPPLREILVPSDLSPASDRALVHARMLARHFDSHLTLYHVVEVPQKEYASWSAEKDDAVWPATRREAFRELSRRCGPHRVRHDVVVEQGLSAHHALLAYVRSQRPDLVVMATHGREGLSHLLLGSTTERVLQHGRRPLLCVRSTGTVASVPYRRLLVPTDLSPASRQAFPLAGLLARTLGAELVVVHVASTSPLPNLGLPLHREARLVDEEAVRRFVAPDLEGLPLRVRIDRGTAWDQIVRSAAAERADLVVMATRGLDSIADRILGSHAERVVRHAPCPVLVA
jgi:nucleotide-binding universal stress UspA family protein